MTIVKVNGEDYQTGIAPGCSSPNGHYVGKHVVLLALEAGWDDWQAAQAVQDYDEWYSVPEWRYYDVWYDMVTEAEVWLNDHTEGGFWMWTDGDFRLVATTECPTCGADVDADYPGECPQHDSWGDL